MTAPGWILVSPTHGNLAHQIKWLVRVGFGFYRANELINGPMNSTQVGSLGPRDSLHRMAVDINLDTAKRITEVLRALGLTGHDFMLSPSVTEGRCYLFVDVALPWDEYTQLLSQMVVDGVIAAEFFALASKRGMTAVPRPGSQTP